MQEPLRAFKAVNIKFCCCRFRQRCAFATRFWNAQNGHILEPINTEKFRRPINLTWVSIATRSYHCPASWAWEIPKDYILLASLIHWQMYLGTLTFRCVYIFADFLLSSTNIIMADKL